MASPVLKAQTRPGNEVTHRAGDEHLFAPRQFHNARRDMDGYATDVVPLDFNLAGMETGAQGVKITPENGLDPTRKLDRVVLALGESRTSGFSWSLADCDQTVCRLVSDTFEPPADSKGAHILELIGRAKGATLAEIMKATDWQTHSVRGFISGHLKKKLGLKVRSSVRDGERVYSIKRRS